MSLNSYHYKEVKGLDRSSLFFTFHGTGGDENQFIGLAANLVPGATIISPRGDVNEHGANRFFRRLAEGVYDLEDLAARTKTMSAFVRAHKARVGAQRVIALGYSNGANILASMLYEDGALFDDVVLMHPLYPVPHEGPGVDNPARVLITAGVHDPIAPGNETQKLAHVLEAAGHPLSLNEHHGGHEIRESEINAIALFLDEKQKKVA